ncbi:hypothetical protein O181_015879 [Austropuccinia psidii MF-1]|uniref:Uncharacterized protein n=1 Tax=Austropuccinia psidii MF-1 TaxID=1389203 RepID=A0A9Q3C2T3_9BASI|nr:hypothetical protein [Austropuccinia psidii MF-1]
MEDSRASRSFQMLASTFEALLESTEADINAVRTEQLTASNIGSIPVSVQELVYGGKKAGVGASAKPLDRKNELLSSSE